MIALSVIHPYPLAIVLGFKPVENRSWRAPAKFIGQQIAIHASKAFDPDDVRDVVNHAVDIEAWHSVPGLATVRDVLRECEVTAGHIVGVATLARCIERGDGDPLNAHDWRSSTQFAFVLTDPVRLARPVPCRGMQGFWQVPVVPADLVTAQLRAAGVPR